MFTVKGESMNRAGIHHEDKVVVDRSLTPQAGDIVVAVVNGEYTIKPIDPGVYDVQFNFVGYTSQELKGVPISGGKIQFANTELSAGKEMKTLEINEFKVQEIEQEEEKDLDENEAEDKKEDINYWRNLAKKLKRKLKSTVQDKKDQCQ